MQKMAAGAISGPPLEQGDCFCQDLPIDELRDAVFDFGRGIILNMYTPRVSDVPKPRGGSVRALHLG